MLTSLMQKSDDNSRTGFELAKQQLKLHIAHQKLENCYMQDILSEARLREKIHHHGENTPTEKKLQIHTDDNYSHLLIPQKLEQPIEAVEPHCIYDYDKKETINSSDFISIGKESINSNETSGFVSVGDESSKSIVPGYIFSSYEAFSSSSKPSSRHKGCLKEPVPSASNMDSQNDDVSESSLTIIPEGYTSVYEPAFSSSKPNSIHKEHSKESVISANYMNDSGSYSPLTIMPEGYTENLTESGNNISNQNDVFSKSLLIVPDYCTLFSYGPALSSKELTSTNTEGLQETVTSTNEVSKLQIAIIEEGIKPGHKPASSSNEVKSSEGSVMSTSQPASDNQTMDFSIFNTITSFMTGSEDSKQTTSSPNVTQPLATAKPGKQSLYSTKKHPLYLFIIDLLITTCSISLPTHHLLNSLAITGPIPLPQFYVKELDNVIMYAVFNKKGKRIQAESPMKQLVKEGVIRKSCYPIVYHKDLSMNYVDQSIQPVFIPQLICDAIKDEMDDTDKALSILSAQHALDNLLKNEMGLSQIYLQYILILTNQLHDVCSQELHDKLRDELLIANEKLRFQVALMARKLKH